MQKKWIHEILKYVKPYKKTCATLFICVSFTSVIDAIYPFLQALLIDEVFVHKNIHFLLFIFISYLVLWAGSQALQFVNMGAWSYMHTRGLFDIRLDMFRKVFRLDAGYLSNMKTGDIISRINNDSLELISLIFRNIITLISRVLRLVFSLTILFIMSWQLALVIVVFTPLLVYVSNYFSSKSGKINREYRTEQGVYSSWLFEMIKGIRDIRLLSGQASVFSKFTKYNKKLSRLKIDQSIITFKSNKVNELILLLITICIYGITGFLAYKNKITLGVFVASFEYFLSCKTDFAWLNDINSRLRTNEAGVNRILDLLSMTEEEYGSDLPSICIDKGNIEFSNITFFYEERKSILENISFKVEKGQAVAIVGESGAGKSTIVSLLMRLYEPNSGIITIDGQNIWEYNLKSIRSNIGVVQQEGLLFDGTIRDNIKVACRNATDADILCACKQANIYDFITSLENGLDTVVGSNGIGISGGQRQRIAIARILLKDPSLLVFDEATSALDNETEREIYEAWEELKQNRSVLIIAHRLSTIINSDKILVLHNGRIVSSGKHDILLKTCRIYQKLFKEQYTKNANEGKRYA